VGVSKDMDYSSQEEASECMSSQIEDGSAGLEDIDGSTVKVNGFVINIDLITNEGLIRMRKLLPKQSYRLMKNRKSARICRLRKKEQVKQVFTASDDLAKENDKLKQELIEAYAKIEFYKNQSSCTPRTTSETPSYSMGSVINNVSNQSSYGAEKRVFEQDPLVQI
jgi:hypothetical protein